MTKGEVAKHKKSVLEKIKHNQSTNQLTCDFDQSNNQLDEDLDQSNNQLTCESDRSYNQLDEDSDQSTNKAAKKRPEFHLREA